jgi:adenosylcobinamide-phosphate synthase
MGDFISFFEKKFYQDNKLWGGLLTLSLLSIVWLISHLFTLIVHELLLAILASMFLAHHMLYTSVRDAIGDKKLLSYLVSRDTKKLSESDMNKALIETYAENLSDGVIAPLFYLLLFGFEGIVVYKAINTLDSMVGYKNSRYQNFGFFSAKLDDIANFIPARLTAILLMLIGKNFNYKLLQNFASLHQSPNAGYPISAVAITHDLTLGGDTSYDGKVLKKPYFGEGKKEILKEDVLKVLEIKKSVDIIILLILGSLSVVSFLV